MTHPDHDPGQLPEEPAPQGDAQGNGPEPVQLPLIRTGVAGVLMGLANLVPGVSGGTMVLVMGLYTRFIDAVADLTRLRFTKGSVLFIGILASIAFVTIASLAGVLKNLVLDHRPFMYSLFLGMTLAGTPLLWAKARFVARRQPTELPAYPGLALCLLAMFGMFMLGRPDPAERDRIKEAMEASGETTVEANPVLDVVGGAVAMSAMVLPGISGAHMLLVLGRYEAVLGAIDLAKGAVTGGDGDLGAAMAVIVPVGIGALVSIIGLTNLLKWLLHHYEKPMAGLLLGVLWGSVFAIWPFTSDTTGGEIALGMGAFVAGLGFVLLLARFAAKADRSLPAPEVNPPAASGPTSR